MRLLHAPSTAVPRHLALPCAGAGAVFFLLALMKCSGLVQGGSVAVGAGLAALVLLALALTWLSYRDPSVLCVCLLAVGLGFFLRVLCLDHITYDYQDFLSVWAAFFRDNGGFAAVALPKGNYNVPYLYFLAAISYFRVPDLYLIKLFSLLFDVLLAWGGLRLAKVLTGPDSLRPLAAFSALLLLPTVILNGAYWGQCDVIYGALILHALASALGKRPAGSVILLGLAFAFKLQSVFLIPLWCAFWFLKRVKFWHLLLFPAVNVAVTLPALLLGKPVGDIVRIYLGQLDEYSQYLTMNAPSVYAFLPYGWEVDVNLVAKVGIAFTFLLVAMLLLTLFRYRALVTDSALLTSAVILAIGVPLLLPHMHERYFFLADVLALCWACVSLRRAWIALGVQVASLGAYHAYLRLQYAFPMAWGAAILVVMLLCAWIILAVQMVGEEEPGQGELRPGPVS